jgi:hypothetical protein
VGYAAVASGVLVLAITQQLDPMKVLAVAFVAGLLKPSDIGMRTALVSATVPADHLVAAMGISRTSQDSARIGGALAGTGFMAAFGMVSAYIIIVVIYLIGLLLTLKVEAPASAQARTAPGAQPQMRLSAWRDLKEGLLHVWRTPRLLAAMSLAALVNLTAFPITGGLMPYVARDVFQLDQQGLGWLVASFATGALTGSVSLIVFGSRVRPARTMLLMCVIWHLCLAGLALPIGLPLAMCLLLAAGFCQSLSMVSLSVLLMRATEERFKGRVMGVRMLAIYTLPFGLLAAGALVQAIGFGAMIVLYVAVGLLLTAAVAHQWRAVLLPHDQPSATR